MRRRRLVRDPAARRHLLRSAAPPPRRSTRRSWRVSSATVSCGPWPCRTGQGRAMPKARARHIRFHDLHLTCGRNPPRKPSQVPPLKWRAVQRQASRSLAA